MVGAGEYDFTTNTPHEHILKLAVKKGLGPGAVRSLPGKWEKLGSVVIIRLSGLTTWPYRLRGEKTNWSEEELALVGQCYASVLDAKTIMVEVGTVSGEFREPEMWVMHGQETETVHLENGVSYKLDAARIMFSSGNVDERIRMGRISMPGETVVDMFAGIGYFSLPIAKYSGCKHLKAIEKNPLSYRYLEENIELNDLKNMIHPVLSDNRDTDIADEADRIVMGYLKDTTEFLPKALDMLKREGGMIYLHDTFGKKNPGEACAERIKGICAKAGYMIKSMDLRRIKSYAPNVWHGVFELALTGD